MTEPETPPTRDYWRQKAIERRWAEQEAEIDYLATHLERIDGIVKRIKAAGDPK